MIQATVHTTFARHRRLPSDPLNESIYNLVLRPQDDRPPPLFKSRFANQVRAEHQSRRSGNGSIAGGGGGGSSSAAGGGLAGFGSKIKKSPAAVPSKSAVNGASYPPRKAAAQTQSNLNAGQSSSPSKTRSPVKKMAPSKATGSTITNNTNGTTRKRQGLPPPTSSQHPAHPRLISKPTSGRIALAAERRSNASTPTQAVADPTRWDNLAADEAEAELLNRLPDLSLHSLPPTAPQPNHRPHVPSNLAAVYTNNDEEVPEIITTQEDDQHKYSPRIPPPPREMHSTSPSTSSSMRSKGVTRRMVPEAERLAILAGLRANHGQLMELYGRMGLSVDTVSKINRKTSMEKQLQLLEEDIKKFSHPNIIVDV